MNIIIRRVGALAWIVLVTGASFLIYIALCFAAEGWPSSSFFVRNHLWLQYAFLGIGLILGGAAAARRWRSSAVNWIDIVSALPVFGGLYVLIVSLVR